MALFKSNYRGFTQVVRHEIPDRSPITGDVIGVKHRRLAASFGVFFGDETNVFNPEMGEMTSVAEIRGGYFDSVVAQARGEWTDEEREAVEQKLRAVGRLRPDYVVEIVPVRVPAPIPWQTYDDTAAEEIAKLAGTLSLVPETLRYERERLARPLVTTALEDLLDDLDDDAKLRAEPLMEIPLEGFSGSARVGPQIGSPPQFTDSGIPLDTPGFVEKPQAITA